MLQLLQGSSGLHIQDFGLSVFSSGVPPIFGQFALLLLFFLAFVGYLSSLWAEFLIRLLQFLVRFCLFKIYFFCSIVFWLLKFYIHVLLWLVFFNFMIYMNSFCFDWVLNCLFGVWDCNPALVFIWVVFVFLEFAWRCRINSMLGC